MDFCCLPVWANLLLCSILLFIMYVMYMSSTHDTFKKMGIPGPTPSYVTGNTAQTMKQGIVNLQVELYHKYKNHKAYGTFDCRIPILSVTDEELIKEVLVKQFNNFTDRRSIMEAAEPFKSSLLFLKGSRWKHVRNVVSPTFSSARMLKKMIPHIQATTKELSKVLEKYQSKEEDVDLKEVFKYFALDAIASSAFGIQTNSQGDSQDEFAQHVDAFLANKKGIILYLIAVFFSPLAKLLTISGLDTFFWPKKAAEYFTNLADFAIDKARERMTSKVESKAESFVELVTQAEGHYETGDQTTGSENRLGLSRKEIRGQAVLFILAGLDTVSNVLAWTTFLLANHPEICKKCQEEIDQVLKGEEPNYDNVQELNYLEMCISETLRMFPNAVFVDRTCTQDTEIQGIKIPRGMVVNIPIYAIHRDPDIWPEPDEFRPERFSLEARSERSQYVYLPFGHGPRNCVGIRLAQVEMKLTLAAVLSKFTPVKCSKTVYPPTLNKLTMRPDDGQWVQFVKRV